MCICILFCGLLPCLTESSATKKLNQRYALGELIGQGASGVTRICTDKRTGERLACKIITNTRRYQDPALEAAILKKLCGHPNIVCFRDAYIDARNKISYLVMELCQGGSLFANRKIYTEREAAHLCKSLLEAVQFCHSQGIVHRDISMKNILLGEDLSVVKLGDFGLATHIRPDEQLKQVMGTLRYMAPEILERRGYGKEIDVWSCGVVLYTILSGNFPFFGNTEKSTWHAITSSTSPKFDPDNWEQASAAVKDLVKGMLQRDLCKRLTPEQVLNHEWILQHTAADSSAGPAGGFVASNLPRRNKAQACFTESSESMQSFSPACFTRDLLVILKIVLGLFFSIPGIDYDSSLSELKMRNGRPLARNTRDPA